MRRSRWPSAALPLRVRLTIWYVLFLGLVLVLFSGYLYVRMQRSLGAQTDAGLELAVAQATSSVDLTGDHPLFQQASEERELAERLSQAGFAVRLISAIGTVWDGFGAYERVPAFVPTTPGAVTIEGQEDWRIRSQPLAGADGANRGWIQAARPLGQDEEALDSLIRQILIGLPLALILAAVGGFVLATRTLHPIDAITRTAHAIGATNLNRRIAHRGPPDEVGRLAATFDGMLDRLQDAFERQRRFTADASHELRTPLTVMKGQLGVVLDRPRTTTEYEEVLRGLEGEVDRLIRLSTDLLFLARLDRQAPLTEAHPVDLTALLEAIIEQIAPLATTRDVDLAVAISSGLSLIGDGDALIRLVLNLVDNALKYTPAGGQVSVSAVRSGTEVRVVIADTGPGIPEEQLPYVFERFSRLEDGRARDTGGAGLGLAIAAEIAQWHGGTIDVVSALGRGSTFTVRLPAGARVGAAKQEQSRVALSP